jgi:hypothetical protein
VNIAAHGEAWIVLDDQDYEEYFSTADGDAVVSESLEAKMREKYSLVDYFVDVEVAAGEGWTKPYPATREIFNSIEVGTKVKFRCSGPTELPEIVELLPSSD